LLNNIFNSFISTLANFSSVFNGLLDGFGGFKFSEISWEWWMAFFVIFVIFLSGFSYGKSRLFLSLISLYLAAFIEPLFPYFDYVKSFTGGLESYMVHLILFFVLYFLTFSILSFSSLKTRFTLKEFTLGPLLLIALIKFGFLTSVAFSYLPDELAPQLAKLKTYFAGDLARFWWAVLPVVTALTLRQKRKDD